MAQRQGDGEAVRNPLTGELYADGVVPQSQITSFAREVLAGLPEPTRTGVSNNFDSCRAVRTTTTSSTSSSISSSTPRRALHPLQQPRCGQLRAAADPGETSSPSNAFVDVLNQQVAGGVTRTLG